MTPLLTLPEVAERLQVSVQTLRSWHRRGLVQMVKLPSGALRMTVAECERLMTPDPARE